MAKKTNTSLESAATRAKATATPKAPAPRHRKAQALPAEPVAAPIAAPVNNQETLTAEPAVATAAVSKPVSSPARPKTSKNLEPVEPKVESSTPKFTITNEDIATLAFSYWESRGYQGGSPDEDWARAEKELSSLLQ